MEKQEVIKALKELREKSKKRKFTQSIDLLVNFKGLDLKKPEHKIDFYLQLPKPRSKPVKFAAFVDDQLAKQARETFDTVIMKNDIENYKNQKKMQRELAINHDFFIAQADLMIPIASTFGKVLGARGKMPSPKAGCVVPGTAVLAPIKERLQKTIRLQTKNELSIKVSVGDESMNDEDIAENIILIYNNLLIKLPQEKNNLRYVAIKTTMSPLIKIGEKNVSQSKSR